MESTNPLIMLLTVIVAIVQLILIPWCWYVSKRLNKLSEDNAASITKLQYMDKLERWMEKVEDQLKKDMRSLREELKDEMREIPTKVSNMLRNGNTED